MHLRALMLQHAVLPAFFFMLLLLVVKWLCIAFYFNLIYGMIQCVKKSKHINRHVQANYYCWYVLLLSFVLANLEVNHYFTSPLFAMLYTDKPYAPYLYVAACFLALLWLSVVIYKMAGYFILNWKIQQSFKYMPPFNDHKNLLSKAKAALGIKREIRVSIAAYIDTPVSYGMVTSCILLPQNYQEKFTHQELYLMLLHELSHIQNGDTVKFRLLHFLECFMWFNPVMGVFLKHFRRDTELLCDSQVMGVQGHSKERYGQLLLKGCSSRHSVAGLGYGFSDAYTILKDRIEGLYRFNPIRHNVTPLATFVVILCMTVNTAVHFVYTNHLNLNQNYNAVFEILLTQPDYSTFQTIDPTVYPNIYAIENDTIYVDQLALRALLGDYASTGYDTVVLSSKNFDYTSHPFEFINGTNYHFSAHELFTKDMPRYFTEKLSNRNDLEHLFLAISGKL